MQMHMDFKVPKVEDLERHHERAETLGAQLLYDRSRDEGESLYVLADPAGHRTPSDCWSSRQKRADLPPVRRQAALPRTEIRPYADPKGRPIP